MESVTSRDGTTIAFDLLGQGPPVVLVSGGSVDRSSHVQLAREPAPVGPLRSLRGLCAGWI